MDGETLGEVVMRGNNVMKGYFEQPDATAEALRGGWFHSGDLAVWHADGYIELRDRKKDIIISGGENISTIEVEHTLVKHPAVLECAVVSACDDDGLVKPKAYVVLARNTVPHPALAQEIQQHVKKKLAHYKYPRWVHFVGELPKTATGKIQRFLLREAV